MMVPIDRKRYMDFDGIKQLRTVTEALHVTDLNNGRLQSVMAWMVIDLVLSKGL